MRRTCLVIALLAFSLPVCAQAFNTVPSGFLAPGSGKFFCNGWGAYHKGRTQYITSGASTETTQYNQAELRTATPQFYTTDNGMGRSWQTVKLTLGHGDVTKLVGTTFSKNILRPRLVFSGAFSLATKSGKPTQAWGNAAVLPFSGPYIYTFTKLAPDFVHDWEWDGGKLSNGAKWRFFKSYLTDGASDPRMHQLLATPTSRQSPGSKWLPRHWLGTPACNDSAITSTNRSAFTELVVRIYSDGHPVVANRGYYEIASSYSQYTAPGAPVIGVLATAGSDPGVTIGARCNRLHANPAAALQIVTATASNDQRAFASFFTRKLRYYRSWYAGRAVYFQGAWADSRTRQLSLTLASKVVMPKEPQSFSRVMVYEAWDVDGNKRTKFGPTRTSAGGAMPLLRLKKK